MDEPSVGVGGAGSIVGRLETTAAKNSTGGAVRMPIQHRILWARAPAQVRVMVVLGGHEVGGGRAASRCGGCGIDCGATEDGKRKKFDRRGRPHADPASDSVGVGACRRGATQRRLRAALALL